MHRLQEKWYHLMKVDLDYIDKHADSTITPIIVTNQEQPEIELVHEGAVVHGDKIAVVKP